MTRDGSPYFCQASENPPFGPERMGERDVFSTESLTCGVNALEPGQRYDPRVHEHADKLHTVLSGRGAFVIGDSRRILGPGDVALAPAGVDHRAFANQGERLVVLVVTCPSPSRVADHPASPEPVARQDADPVSDPPSPSPAPLVATETRSVPVVMKPAELPLELPMTRPSALTIRTPGGTGSEFVKPSSGFSLLLDSLRVQKETSAAGAPPVIPETKRCAPRSSRVRAETGTPSRPAVPLTPGRVTLPPGKSEAPLPRSGSASSGSGGPPNGSAIVPDALPAPARRATSTGSDWLPAIFRKSEKEGAPPRVELCPARGGH